MPVNPLYTDSQLNFNFDKITSFVESQLPAFIKTEGQDFIDFTKAYYTFLESKNIAIIVSSKERLTGTIELGQSVGSVHCLMCEDGITYIGGTGEESGEEALIELDAFRNDTFTMSSNATDYVVNERVTCTNHVGVSTGAIAYVKSWNSVSKKLILTLPDGTISYNDYIIGDESGAAAYVTASDNSLFRPTSIYGTALGGIDIDTISENVMVPRKKIIMNHLSGAVERFLTESSDTVGELYNSSLLEGINYYTIEISRFDANTSFDFIIGERTLGYFANNELTGREGTIYEILEETSTTKRIKIIKHKGESKNISYYIVGQESGAKALLNSVTAPALPSAFSITEIKTPIYAYNNIANFGDIDYMFDNKQFLGSDYYNHFANEIMANWPAELAYPTEQYIKALIGRNIKDFYKSKGTEDSIKFLFRVLYGKNAELFYPSNRIFYLNDGRWFEDYQIKVYTDTERDILKAQNRNIYDASNSSYRGLIESVEETYIDTYFQDITVQSVANNNMSFIGGENIIQEDEAGLPDGVLSSIYSWDSENYKVRCLINDTEGVFVTGKRIRGVTSNSVVEIVSIDSSSSNKFTTDTEVANIKLSSVFYPQIGASSNTEGISSAAFGVGSTIEGSLINAEQFSCKTAYEIRVAISTDVEYRALRSVGNNIFSINDIEANANVRNVWKENTTLDNGSVITTAVLMLTNFNTDHSFFIGDVIVGTINKESLNLTGTLIPGSNTITDIKTTTGDVPRGFLKNMALVPTTVIRSNYFKYSQDFADIYWTNTNCTIESTSNVSPISPDTIELIRCIDNGINGVSSIVNFDENNIDYTWSIYAKREGSSYIGLSNSIANTLVNLDTSEVVSNNNCTVLVDNLDDEWNRVKVTFFVPSGTSTDTFNISVSDGSNSNSGYANTSLFIFGSQLEKGNKAYKYIKTTSASISNTVSTPSTFGNLINIDSIDSVTFDNTITGTAGWIFEEVPITISSLFKGQIVSIQNTMIFKKYYGENRGLLNGGPLQDLPTGYTEWNSEAAALVANPDMTDRIQDSEYYQLFSYVIRTDMEPEKFDEVSKVLKKLVHPSGYKMTLETTLS